MTNGTDRRDFLKMTTTAALGLALPAKRQSMAENRRPTDAAADYRPTGGFAAPALEKVRIGFVGVGLQGGSHVMNFLKIEGVEITALCDTDADRAQEVANWVAEAGAQRPDLYTRGETDFKRLCEGDDTVNDRALHLAT